MKGISWLVSQYNLKRNKTVCKFCIIILPRAKIKTTEDVRTLMSDNNSTYTNVSLIANSDINNRFEQAIRITFSQCDKIALQANFYLANNYEFT